MSCSSTLHDLSLLGLRDWQLWGTYAALDLQRVFPAQRRLADLRQLSLPCREFAGADVKRVVQCCPALDKLAVFGEPAGGAVGALSPLTELSGLTQLSLRRLKLTTRHAAAVAQLTGLRHLAGFCDMTARGLLQLTALRQLTVLELKPLPRFPLQQRPGMASSWITTDLGHFVLQVRLPGLCAASPANM